MKAVPPFSTSLLGILLLVVKLSVLLVQNRVHLYNFLLHRIMLFKNWLSGLVQEAQGSHDQQAHPLPRLVACPVGWVLQAGLSLIKIPVWLGLRAPRLVWEVMLGCVWDLGLDLKWLGAWEHLGQSVATWMDLLLSCLHNLMLAALLLLLLTWRLCWKAHRCSLGWLHVEVQHQVVLGLLALLKRLYWWVESTTELASWHLVYLVTWTTCLAFHLLQAAFEHTAQLAQAQAQAQEAEPQEASGSLSQLPLHESLTPKAGPVLPEHGTPGE